MKIEKIAMYVLLTAVIVAAFVISNGHEVQVRGAASVAVGEFVTKDKALAKELEVLGAKAAAALEEDFREIERSGGASLSVDYKGYGVYTPINYRASGSGEIHGLVSHLLTTAYESKYRKLAAGSPQAAAQDIVTGGGGTDDHLTPVGRGCIILILVAAIAMLFIVRRTHRGLTAQPARATDAATEQAAAMMNR